MKKCRLSLLLLFVAAALAQHPGTPAGSGKGPPPPGSPPLGPSGGLKYGPDGALDINTVVVPQLGTPDTWTALNIFQAGLNLRTHNPQPNCDRSHRGELWFREGDPRRREADSFEVCEYNGASYAWTNGDGSGSVASGEGDHVYHRGNAPMVTGAGCSLRFGNDNTGEIAASSPTTCTIKWATAWRGHYTFHAQPFSGKTEVDISHRTGTAVTVAVSAADTIDYSARGVE